MRVSCMLNSGVNSDLESHMHVPASASLCFAVRDAAEDVQSMTSTAKRVDGSTQTISFAGKFKESYKDKYTGEVLPQDLVEQALAHTIALI